jgi:hypothetical protein
VSGGSGLGGLGELLGFRAFYRTMMRSRPLNQRWMVINDWAVQTESNLDYFGPFRFLLFI